MDIKLKSIKYKELEKIKGGIRKYHFPKPRKSMEQKQMLLWKAVFVLSVTGIILLILAGAAVNGSDMGKKNYLPHILSQRVLEDANYVSMLTELSNPVTEQEILDSYNNGEWYRVETINEIPDALMPELRESVYIEWGYASEDDISDSAIVDYYNETLIYNHDGLQAQKYSEIPKDTASKIREEILREREDMSLAGLNELEDRVNFLYEVVNKKDKKVYSNVLNTEEYDPEQTDFLVQDTGEYYYYEVVDGKASYDEDAVVWEKLKETNLIQNNANVYMSIPHQTKKGDIYFELSQTYERVQFFMKVLPVFLIILTLLLLVSGIRVIGRAGNVQKAGKVKLYRIDKLPNGVLSLFCTFVIAGLLYCLWYMFVGPNDGGLSYSAEQYLNGHSTQWREGVLQLIAVIGLCILIVYVTMEWLLSKRRHMLNRSYLQNSLFYRVYCTWRIAAKITTAVAAFLLLQLILIIVPVGIYAIQGSPDIGVLIGAVCGLIVDGLALAYILKLLDEFKRIEYAVTELSQGNTNIAIYSKKAFPIFKSLIAGIDNIQSGLSIAIKKAIQGERMKTELITNVSHDLKTPLTSIINYVDLLDKENVDNGMAVEYIEILKDKSQRLKTLIENVVEASKASSGNMVLNMEKIEIKDLMSQSLCEFEGKLQDNQIEMIVTEPNQEVYIQADGHCMWRIIENLMNNAVKYTMTGTRLYVDIKQTSENVRIEFKNISKIQLNITSEELMMRFVRGDESRTTDGSGLGLSIVKNLVELQKGRFNVVIDGDLFKACIEFPLA